MEITFPTKFLPRSLLLDLFLKVFESPTFGILTVDVIANKTILTAMAPGMRPPPPGMYGAARPPVPQGHNPLPAFNSKIGY